MRSSPLEISKCPAKQSPIGGHFLLSHIIKAVDDKGPKILFLNLHGVVASNMLEMGYFHFLHVFFLGARRQFYCRMKTGNKAYLSMKYEKDSDYGELGTKKKKSGIFDSSSFAITQILHGMNIVSPTIEGVLKYGRRFRGWD